MFTSNNRLEKNFAFGGIDCGMVVPARPGGLNISETAVIFSFILGCSDFYFQHYPENGFAWL